MDWTLAQFTTVDMHIVYADIVVKRSTYVFFIRFVHTAEAQCACSHSFTILYTIQCSECVLGVCVCVVQLFLCSIRWDLPFHFTRAAFFLWAPPSINCSFLLLQKSHIHNSVLGGMNSVVQCRFLWIWMQTIKRGNIAIVCCLLASSCNHIVSYSVHRFRCSVKWTKNYTDSLMWRFFSLSFVCMCMCI